VQEIWPGQPYPLGAHFDGEGTNFSVFSEAADSIELCLFDEEGRERRLTLPEQTAFCHHGYLPGVGPGRAYGFRAHGPWDPAAGLRMNPAKLLLDPYAKAIEGRVRWSPAVYGHRAQDPELPDRRDSGPYVPRSVVVHSTFDWDGDRPPARPLHETVVYETHVRALTMRHPGVADPLRGTYAGMASPAVIRHLVELGITAVELLPIHHFVPEPFLVERGLTNFWGYSSVGYFAPHGPYAWSGRRGEQVDECKALIRSLHAAGIEVILDVVYNHTGEGNHLGPTLCLRGLDNATYYRLDPSDRRRYVDYTGTGNTLNMRHPQVLQLVMDSLRYWVLEMHVDGFRFDLASTLAREEHAVDRLSAFFDLIHQDPVVSQVKLIAEPWDVGDGGYQVGNFPVLWSEWNARYRDGVRDYWRGAPESLADFAYRFTGSSDLYGNGGRQPVASVNFVTAHDGFTLRDLVSYDRKHNLANGEQGRDGTDDNRSWNSGVEGDTDDPDVLELRGRRVRAMLATLMLSQGVPMLLGGDEMGRSQRGNNNAYCHDDTLSWYDWDGADRELLRFTGDLIALRRRHPVFRRRRFFHGRPVLVGALDDIGWFRPDGTPMTDEDWQVGFARSLAVFLNGHGIPSAGPRGERVVDDSFLVLCNAHDAPIVFTVPEGLLGHRWSVAMDTAAGTVTNGDRACEPRVCDTWEVPSWAIVLLRDAGDDAGDDAGGEARP
jgi:isoamylase